MLILETASFERYQPELDKRLRVVASGIDRPFGDLRANALSIVEWSVGKYVFEAWKNHWICQKTVFTLHFQIERPDKCQEERRALLRVFECLVPIALDKSEWQKKLRRELDENL